MRKPQPAPELPEDVAEVLHDALEGRHRSAESYEEDVRDAFQALPKANIEAAAAVCHDMGNEAMKSEKYNQAVSHCESDRPLGRADTGTDRHCADRHRGAADGADQPRLLLEPQVRPRPRHL